MPPNPYNTLLDLLNAGAHGTEAVEKVREEGSKLLDRAVSGVVDAKSASGALRALHDVLQPEGVAPHIQAVLPPISAFIKTLKPHLK